MELNFYCLDPLYRDEISSGNMNWSIVYERATGHTRNQINQNEEEDCEEETKDYYRLVTNCNTY